MDFLAVGAWDIDGQRFEIASRPKLDSRIVLPFFMRGEELHAGILERARPSRELRGAPRVGLEAIGFDFSGVDETADIASYGRAIFTARAGVEIDDTALAIALPSMARSIGYLTELTLPLLLGIKPPPCDDLEVSWDGSHHRILFRPVAEWLRLLGSKDAPPCGEELFTLLRALTPPTAAANRPARSPAPDDGFVARHAAHVWTAEQLAASLAEGHDPARGRRVEPAPESLRFLQVRKVEHDGHTIELVTPASGVSVSLLPYVMSGATAYFVLWNETRAAALERRARQPLYDLPVPVRYANATGFFVSPEEERVLASDPRALATELLRRAFGSEVVVREVERLGPAAEPASSVSTEIRHRLACALDGASIGALPKDAFVISAPELARAVARGLVKDPVVTAGLLELAAELGVDPFAEARRARPLPRRAFIDTMTEGSVVQRRLKAYSSIEHEQLRAPTYARLMTLLQHEFGLRIVFPRADKDRGFFKAAYRVFMAADRGEDRALQGLHFSHDAFHFALGNFTPPPPPDFDDWYVSGAAPPEAVNAKPEGKAWEVFHEALKHAENEATFFSFWTLYHEHLPLARHVGKLTFYEALRDLGITTRDAAWKVYLEVVHEAVLPEAIRTHPVYAARKDVSGLFDYMLGFRDYHTKDIATAWRFAVKEPYRGYTTRFGIYEHDLERYLRHVHSFSERLASYPPGLNPLLASCADVRVDLSLRVWDVVKALKLLRAASVGAGAPDRSEDRRSFLRLAEDVMRELEAQRGELGVLRARVADAEMTPNNEETLASVRDLASRVERTREALWDRVGQMGLLEDAVIADERTRELPR